MANFEAFHQVISSSINLLFLKSVTKNNNSLSLQFYSWFSFLRYPSLIMLILCGLKMGLEMLLVGLLISISQHRKYTRELLAIEKKELLHCWMMWINIGCPAILNMFQVNWNELNSNLFQNRHCHKFSSYFPPTFEFLNSLLSRFWLSKCV